MYFDDHSPLLFHADYGGIQALFRIGGLNIMKGQIPAPRSQSGLRVGITSQGGVVRSLERRRVPGASLAETATKLSSCVETLVRPGGSVVLTLGRSNTGVPITGHR